MTFANDLVVGIYFNPKTDFDDITEKLTDILENTEISDDTSILLEG